MFNSFALIQYFEDNKNLPHISKYHRENCKEHCMLVIDAMAERTKDRTMLIAACLHDIAKPRTQALNKIGEPCFYGHDEVTDDDIAPFLTAEDECYAYVKALIFCHMVPYKVENAKEDSREYQADITTELCVKLVSKVLRDLLKTKNSFRMYCSCTNATMQEALERMKTFTVLTYE